MSETTKRLQQTDAIRALIREGLEDRGISATELAKRIGRKPDYIRDFLNGRKQSLNGIDLSKIELTLNLFPGSLARGVLSGNPDFAVTADVKALLDAGEHDAASIARSVGHPVEAIEAWANTQIAPSAEAARWANRQIRALARQNLKTAKAVADAASEVSFGGVVEAGAFRQQDLIDNIEFADPSDVRLVAASPRLPGYPGIAQIGYVVRGDSMNELGIMPGMVAVGLAYGDYVDRVGPVRSGEIVVVRRSRNGGHEIELTIKEFQDFPDRIELAPRSTNKAHRTIVVQKNAEPDDGNEVAVAAVIRHAGFVFDGGRR